MDLILMLAAMGAGLFTAWIIGATGASPAFGPVNSSGTVSIFQGSLVVGIAALLGAVTQGQAVTQTIEDGLVTGITFDPLMASVVLVLASAIIFTSVITQYPIPTVLVLIGAVIGAGMTAGGTPNMETLQLIVGYWVAIPFVAIAIGYGTARFLRAYVPNTPKNKKYIRSTLFILATYTAYTAGANQVGLAVGPLRNVIDAPVIYFLLFGGLGMMVGAWTGAPRIIEAIGRDYSKMGPRRGIAALLAASLLAQVGTLMGVPVSFNLSILSAIVGAGLVEGRAGVGQEKIFWTLLGWVGTLIISVSLAAIITRVLLQV